MIDNTPKMMFGIQTEICGGISPDSANVRNNVKNRIKIKDNKNPKVICGPVPPRLLRDDTITPINTSIKIVNGEVYRVYFSTSYTSTPVEPLALNVLI